MSEYENSGVGQALASAREAKGLTQADVAEKLKLTTRQIEALESEEFSKLPAAVFVRGFIRNYARIVDLDADSLVERVGGAKAASETITAPSEGVTISRSPLTRWLVYLVGGLGVFLLLVALLYSWLKQGENTLVTGNSGETTAAVQPALPPPAQEAVPTTVAATDPVPAAPPAAEPAQAPIAPPPTAPSPVSLATKPPARQVAPVPQAQANDNKPEDGAALRFTASDVSWIQVVDGQGRRFSKLLPAGGSDSLNGTPPFRVVVGNAAAVKLHYNSQMIDLRPFTGDKVARLTLE